MNTFTGYINYGCLGAEKRQIWTALVENNTATCSDKVEITVPEGWRLYETKSGDQGVTAPWGWDYSLNEVLAGNEYPHFIAIDKDRKEHRIRLDYKKL